MTALVIEALRVAVDGREILKGLDLEIAAGEVHAVMGPRGAGTSTLANVIAGRPGFDVLGGSVRISTRHGRGTEPTLRSGTGGSRGREATT